MMIIFNIGMFVYTRTGLKVQIQFKNTILCPTTKLKMKIYFEKVTSENQFTKLTYNLYSPTTLQTWENTVKHAKKIGGHKFLCSLGEKFRV